MKFFEIIEPSNSIKNKNYYHGTRSNPKEIIKNGLIGRIEQSRSHLAPIKNHVYVTDNISYAIIYALGGDYSSRMIESDQVGHVFVIPGERLSSIQPDEDSIGDFFYKNTTSDKNPNSNMNFKEQQIYNFIKSVLTPTQVKKIIDGEYSYYAAGGKRVLKIMPNWMKEYMIENIPYVHISHQGMIRPSECWRISKKDIPNLKKDGSNFFHIAKLIWSE